MSSTFSLPEQINAKFWVGRGDTPSPQGIRIPDENGKESPLRRYDRKTIVLTLPGELTVFDIGHFAVWCEAFTVNFGHVVLPAEQVAKVPPSLKMLGVSPQDLTRSIQKFHLEVTHVSTSADCSTTPARSWVSALPCVFLARLPPARRKCACRGPWRTRKFPRKKLNNASFIFITDVRRVSGSFLGKAGIGNCMVVKVAHPARRT
ncbi:hypothetical protein EVAR_81465_1 [Eumeta japonica]|uniref:DM13 domain-containing protein n=1 Tax=Eumeta variegata TaxID=151549 RepID=A0A4C1VZA8_EUMVA|nr:hypothetical protein EVAR_81465_1 [Eumeta japonica]